MFKINIKRKTNGNGIKSKRSKERKSPKSEKVTQRFRHLGVRRISCGLLQYDGVYTSNKIPRKRN